MRLHIGKLGTIKLFETVDGQLLHLVHYLAAAVIAGSGIALSILVGQAGTERCQYIVTDKVFRSDELDAVKLAALLLLLVKYPPIISLQNYTEFSPFAKVFYKATINERFTPV